MTAASSLFGRIPSLEDAAQELRARIDVYDESIHVAVRTERGLRRMEVAPEQLAQAFQGIGLSTGILPRRTLFWQARGSGVRTGIEIPPGQRLVTWVDRNGQRHQGSIPYPRLAFLGEDRTYRIFALKDRKLNETTILFDAPFPNVYHDGRICLGTAPFPQARPETMERAFEVFMESEFNADLSGKRCRSYPHDIRELWSRIRGRKRYPPGELIESRFTLGDLSKGDETHGTH